MADTIRDLAEQEPHEIRQQIDETRSSLTEKLEALEDHVTDTVQNARESVEETFQTVKETVQETVATVKETFNLPLQVERHPWAMLGGAFVAGLVSGAMVGETRRRWRRMPVERLASRGEVPSYPEREAAPEPPRPGLFGRFREEVDQLKGMGLGMLMGVIRDVIQENVPQLAEHVGPVMDRITTKLGGQPVPGPVLKPE
jgi:ElaB/YqjD/DUF883 family membrane-anchored ribosome-binding protein